MLNTSLGKPKVKHCGNLITYRKTILIPTLNINLRQNIIKYI